MCPETIKCSLYSTKNFHYKREDNVTKIISTHIRNINNTFIGIFIGKPLRYIVH